MANTHPTTKFSNPAFPTQPPVPNGLSGEEYGLNTGFPGLSIREYFTIHAPKEIPDWFKPVMATKCPTYLPGLYTILTIEEKEFYDKYYDTENDEWCGNPQTVKESVKIKIDDYIKLQRKNLEDINDWNKEYGYQRYFQWPRYYAENQIKILNADLTPEQNEKDAKD